MYVCTADECEIFVKRPLECLKRESIARVIDLNALHEAFVSNLGSEKIPVQIMPKETIKLGRDDLEALIRCIKEA